MKETIKLVAKWNALHTLNIKRPRQTLIVTVKHFLTSFMIPYTLRSALQTLLQSIFLKPLKMIVEKLYLYVGWSKGGTHPIRAGGVGESTYHQKVYTSLTKSSQLKYFESLYQSTIKRTPHNYNYVHAV